MTCRSQYSSREKSFSPWIPYYWRPSRQHWCHQRRWIRNKGDNRVKIGKSAKNHRERAPLPIVQGAGWPLDLIWKGARNRSVLRCHNVFMLLTILAIGSYRYLVYLTNSLSFVASCLIGYVKYIQSLANPFLIAQCAESSASHYRHFLRYTKKCTTDIVK